MAVICCSLSKFVNDMYSGYPQWKWPKLVQSHTYIIIFAKHQTSIWNAFNKVKHQVNILADIPNCTNVVHPDGIHQGSRNRVVVFEIPLRVGPPKPRKKRTPTPKGLVDEPRSKVRSLPEVSF